MPSLIVKVMDVPGKWGLDDFLDLANAVATQHGVNRRTVLGMHRASCCLFLLQ